MAQSKSDITTVSFSKVPYRVGERLTYNVSFANFSTAAHIELWVAGYGTYFNRQGLQLRAHVETTGVVNAALYSINNDYIAYINPETGEPYRTQLFRREGGRADDISLEYNEPAGIEAIPAKLRTGDFPGTYDFISALYRLRALPLTEGSRYRFAVRDNEARYEAELRVTGRQTVKTNVGSFNTIVTQLRFPKNSSLDNYRAQIYFSDDERHVPVMFTAQHPAGDIQAELAGSELPGGAAPSPADRSTPEIAVSPTQVQPAPNPTMSNPAVSNPATGNPGSIPGIPGIPMSPNTQPPVLPNTPSKTTPLGIPRTPNATPPVTLNTTPNADPNKTSTALPAGLPFTAGEQLNFNVYLENAAQPAGTVSFQVRARSKYFGRDGVLLTGKAQANGSAQNIFSDIGQVNTYVDPTTLLPFRFEMTAQASKPGANQTITIDQDRGNATTEAGARLEIPVGTYDLLSVIYALRSFNLKSSKPNAVSLLVNDTPRTLFITFLKRESIELSGQQIPALQLSLTTDDPQGDKNSLRLWVSEDQRRLPLRMTAMTPAGRVRADLAIIPVVRQ